MSSSNSCLVSLVRLPWLMRSLYATSVQKTSEPNNQFFLRILFESMSDLKLR
ncbi:hypothetical protein [Myxosarcina sp. GI1]|uniref:hypothetical protein n=1 Tax=Myxosarcina sp. GI1 TaxID=1541065 RepID=UPI001C103D20|nr:hypothetical protein [Myxosarcina sp. GI1]